MLWVRKSEYLINPLQQILSKMSVSWSRRCLLRSMQGERRINKLTTLPLQTIQPPHPLPYISHSNSICSGTTIIAGAKSDHINLSVSMPQVGFDPPVQSHTSYEASALPTSHNGWTNSHFTTTAFCHYPLWCNVQFGIMVFDFLFKMSVCFLRRSLFRLLDLGPWKLLQHCMYLVKWRKNRIKLLEPNFPDKVCFF